MNTLVPQPPLQYNTLTPPVPTYDPTTAAQLQNYIQEVASVDNSILDANHIQQGDILFLNNARYNGKDNAHTALVAGWGAPLMSWAELANKANQLSQGQLVYNKRQDAIDQGISNPVPYVIDHGPAGVPTSDPNGNSPFVYPRPYYMLWWPTPLDTNGQLYLRYPIFGNISFLHIPDTLVFSANPLITPPYTSTYVLYPPTGLDPTQLINGHH